MRDCRWTREIRNLRRLRGAIALPRVPAAAGVRDDGCGPRLLGWRERGLGVHRNWLVVPLMLNFILDPSRDGFKASATSKPSMEEPVSRHMRSLRTLLQG